MWFLPLLGGSAALGMQLLQGSGWTLSLGLRTSLACGAGFLAAVTWTLVEDQLRTRKRKPSTNELADGMLEQDEQIRTVRESIGLLEDRFNEFLARRDVDSTRVDNNLLDLTHDVANLRTRNPSDELRPQLKAIADKFGELAGVRAVVANLSSKVRRVEGLADQVKLVERRILAAAESGAEGPSGLNALGERLGDLHQSLSSVLSDDIGSVPLEETKARLEALESKVNSLSESFVSLREEVTKATEPEGLSEALMRAISAQARIPSEQAPASLSREYDMRRAA